MRMPSGCSVPGNKLCILIEYKPIMKSFECFRFVMTKSKFCRDVLEPYLSHSGNRAEVNILYPLYETP
jgi:hypothetical protein